MLPSRDPRDRVPARFQPTRLIVHYNEIALKGRNRRWFEDILARNMRLALGSGSGFKVEKLYGRLAVGVGPGADWRCAAARLARVFGIAYMVPVVIAEPTLEALEAAAAEAVEGERAGGREPPTFGVRCKRATKDYPFTSADVQCRVGARIQAAAGWRVHLDAPDVPVVVEDLNMLAFLGFGRVEGPGGLPTGASGRVACLLSGGIDSPVAAYQILRRGATAVYVHFHSFPHTGIESQEKARDLAEMVQPPGHRSRLWKVPFAELQRRIVTEAPAALRVVLYRRFMVRTAEAIARREGALALVTGENLGQVASQTLENLHTIDGAVSMPVLRPLIGLDKREIIDLARRIGTYEASIEPHGDCCSFLMPPNPATRSRPEDLAAAETAWDVAAEVDRLVESSAVEQVGACEAGILAEIQRKD
ncbi:MAG: tRNA 4-thiouridine(8) synthase ThiI [Planctomycetes bacterium]|nr:tRNA 4-thiouridine(8) synthase ThiI [Planctomycetota bacterium]